MTTSDEFLQAVLADLRIGVDSYRNDRKLPENAGLTDGQFLHGVGLAMRELVAEGMSPTQAVLSTPTAMHRIIQLEDALRDAAEAAHAMTCHGVGRAFEECRSTQCSEWQGIINQGREG